MISLSGISAPNGFLPIFGSSAALTSGKSECSEPKVDAWTALAHVFGMSDNSLIQGASDGRLVEKTILALAGGCGPGKTICPMDAAKAVAVASGDESTWHRHLGAVRRTAVGLARDGRLVIYRKGRLVDPDDFRGVYRLGLPRCE